MAPNAAQSASKPIANTAAHTAANTADTFDVVIIGGGIVGLATALALNQRHPQLALALIEKEDHVAAHQTGHNSGVIHSGIYYKPGSLKARLCVSGARRMIAFCQEHHLPYNLCGKVIVAANEAELPRLETLFERGIANGVPGLSKIGRAQLLEIEPHAAGIAAIHSPNTGIVDYKAVSRMMADMLRQRGVAVCMGTAVTGVQPANNAVRLTTTATQGGVQGAVTARYIVNCGGLHADRIAEMAGAKSDVRIVPFRGEYYMVKPEREHLVNGLIYPVPDPEFPFLGVHFTRMIGGGVEAGPNAVFAFAREGYTVGKIRPKEMWWSLGFAGFQKFARKWWRVGAYEMFRSFSKAEFVRSLQKLVPEIRSEDIERGGAGVRAQALSADGALVDDFKLIETPNALHVVNAPSPAATASLAIGDYIAEQARIPMPTR